MCAALARLFFEILQGRAAPAGHDTHRPDGHPLLEDPPQPLSAVSSATALATAEALAKMDALAAADVSCGDCRPLARVRAGACKGGKTQLIAANRTLAFNGKRRSIAIWCFSLKSPAADTLTNGKLR
jgi:hypothetical protein